ncbi:MAG: AMIN domain-containing protein, partial [Longimicrobiales bacterium]
MTSTLLALLSAGLTLGLGGPVTEVSIRPAPSATTEILIAVDGEVEFREFTMEGPSRLVVDLFGARHQLPGDNFANLDRGGVRSVRTSQYSDDVVRVVLELESLAAYEVVSEPGRIRVVMENLRGEFEPWSSGDLDTSAAPVAAAPAERVEPMPPPATTMAVRTPPQQEARRISVTFNETPIREVLFTFSD